MKNPELKFTSYCFYYKKQGHQIHECRSRIKDVFATPRFKGYFYDFQKYGHRAYQSRS